MLSTMLPEKELGRDKSFGHFSKLPQRKSYLDNISSSNLHRILILVSTPVFMVKEPNETTNKKIGSFLCCEFEKKSKMAAMPVESRI